MIKQLQYNAPCNPAYDNCSEVLLCLDPSWRTKTKCGLAFAKAKIVGVGYKCSEGQTCCPTLPSGNSLYADAPTQGNFTCVYNIQIDRDAEFLTDPSTIPLDQPYDILPSDIQSIAPYLCHFSEIITNIKDKSDWVVDSSNVEVESSPETNTYIVTVPIIDRIDNSFKNSFTLDLSVLFDHVEPIVSTDTLSDYGVPVPNGHRHIAYDGTPQDILLLSQVPGNLLSYDNGLFIDCAAVAACVTAGITYTAGDCIDLTGDEISVKTSGTWGSGDLSFPCADTSGQSIYCDSNGDLRTAPPVQAFQLSAFTGGVGNDPAPVSINVVNPSNCREARVTGGYTGAFNYTAPSASAGGPILQLGLNGNPVTPIAQMIGSAVGGSIIGGTYLSSDHVDGNLPTIAPGGTQTHSVDYFVDPNGGSISSHSVSMRLTVIVI